MFSHLVSRLVSFVSLGVCRHQANGGDAAGCELGLPIPIPGPRPRPPAAECSPSKENTSKIFYSKARGAKTYGAHGSSIAKTHAAGVRFGGRFRTAAEVPRKHTPQAAIEGAQIEKAKGHMHGVGLSWDRTQDTGWKCQLLTS